MYRTWVILRHTFLDTVVQPIYTLLIALGVVIVGIFAALPFFTLGEDTVMYKSVSIDVILLVVLIATLFATSKSIFEEIEDRTMLTLMSKPVSRWQVLLGKYLGIISAALVAVAILGLVLLFTWWRIPGDYQLRVDTLHDVERARIFGLRIMHITGLALSLLAVWLQVSVLAAIGVALSTRFSLVVNLPAVIIIYIAGNLTRFLQPIWENTPGSTLYEKGPITRLLAQLVSVALPYLAAFDLREFTITGKLAVPGTDFASHPQAFALSTVSGQLLLAAASAACYITFALIAGMLLFRTRELGGSEG
jgi:ABC-type Na+ efflux pump permease subunit